MAFKRYLQICVLLTLRNKNESIREPVNSKNTVLKTQCYRMTPVPGYLRNKPGKTVNFFLYSWQSYSGVIPVRIGLSPPI